VYAGAVTSVAACKQAESARSWHIGEWITHRERALDSAEAFCCLRLDARKARRTQNSRNNVRCKHAGGSQEPLSGKM